VSTAEVETELRPREAPAYPNGTCYRERIPAERAARTFGASCRHVRVQVGADLIQERSDHSILLADDEASEGLNHPWKWRRGACAADRRCVQVARQRPWAGEGAAARPLGYERRRAADRGWRHCGDRANRRHSGAAPAAVQPDRAAVPGPLARRRIHWGTASVRRDEQGCEVLWFLPGEVPHRPPESLGWRRRSLASPFSAQWHSEL
jgi:hypothetical protein